MNKYALLVFSFTLPCISALSQNLSDDVLLNERIKSKINYYADDILFVQASEAYLQHNWDSTIVITQKILNLKSVTDQMNYVYFYRGLSFSYKKVFNEAQKNLQSIDQSFEFYHAAQTVLGEILLEQKHYKTAIQFLSIAETDSSNSLKSIKKSGIKHNIGICYLHLGQYEKSEIYLLEGLRLQQLENDTTLLVGSYGDLANLYYEQYKDNLAIPYFEKAYLLAKKTKSFQMKETTAHNMAIVEENRKNYPKALIYRKEYEMWHDSLNDQNKIYEIAQKEKQFEVAQKQNEVNLLQAENKASIAERNGFLYTAVALFLLLALGGYLYTEKIKRNRLIALQKEELNELNNTKDKLFSVVSHDLRTSVNTLKINHSKLQNSYQQKKAEEVESLLKTNSSLATSTYNLLDNLFQWALMQTKQAYFSIESMKLFFTIEQVAYNYEALFQNKDIRFKNSLEKSTTILADQESLKIVLRNLLDNAIKYSQTGAEINVYLQNDTAYHCDLVIEDTGIGITNEILQLLQQENELSPGQRNGYVKGTGLGLQLCKSLIKKNNGQLRIESQEGIGTKMILTFPKTQTIS